MEPARHRSARLLSLDVFRGLTIAGMILVNSRGNEHAYAQLRHADWNGCTLTDLVFPFFVFIAALSVVFSLSKQMERGEAFQRLMLRIVRRTIVIFGLGLLLNGFPFYPLDTLRIPGVLQRIALCYFFAAVAFLQLRPKAIAAVAFGLLVGYWLLMTQVPVPGFGQGDLSREGNLAAFLDRVLLSGHLYREEYDPEGLLSTLPAVATALLGVLTGILLRSGRTDSEKLTRLLGWGAAAAALGWGWHLWFPINKSLWTSSYVLWTAGLALGLMAGCYWLVEMRKFRTWSKPFQVFGSNAIAAYVLHVLVLKIQNHWPVPRLDGSLGNLRLFFTPSLTQERAIWGILPPFWPKITRKLLILGRRA